MRSVWRNALLAGLVTFLLACAGKRLAIDAATPQQIGSGLDAMVLVPAGYFIRGSTLEEVDDAHRMAKKVYRNAKREWFEIEIPQRRIYLDAFYIVDLPRFRGELSTWVFRVCVVVSFRS